MKWRSFLILAMSLCLPAVATDDCGRDLSSLHAPKLEGAALAERIRDLAAFELDEVQEKTKPSSAKVGLAEDLKSKIAAAAKLSGLPVDVIRTRMLEAKRDLLFASARPKKSTAEDLESRQLEGAYSLERSESVEDVFFRDAAFARNGFLLAAGKRRQGIGGIWNLDLKLILGMDLQLTDSIRLSDDATWTASGKNNGDVHLWDVQQKQSWFARGHTKAVRALAFNADAGYLATGSDDQTVRIWHTRTHQTETEIKDIDSAVASVSFDPLGLRVAVGLASGRVTLWSRNGTRLSRLEGGSLQNPPSIAFSPDGKRLAAGGGHEVKIWEVETGRLLPHPPALDQKVTAIAFGANGKKLFCGCEDGHVDIFMLEKAQMLPNRLGRGQPEKSLEHLHAIKSIRPTAHGMRLLIVSEANVQVWANPRFDGADE